MQMSDTTPSRALGSVWASALRQTAPVILGYLPVGFAYGVLAQQTGLSPVNTILMSLLVYAGSAQLIAVGLLGAGVSMPAIIATTFVVNLRHLLMSASLAPYLKGWSKRLLSLLTFQLTDEAFAIHATRFANNELGKQETLAINMLAQSAWVLGSVLGVMSSTLISDVKPIGLDFALPAMFIALLVAQLKKVEHALVAIVGGGLSVLFDQLGAEQWSVIYATVLAATFGVGVESWRKKQSS